jgi:hypothetical protein
MYFKVNCCAETASHVFAVYAANDRAFLVKAAIFAE